MADNFFTYPSVSPKNAHDNNKSAIDWRNVNRKPSSGQWKHMLDDTGLKFDHWIGLSNGAPSSIEGFKRQLARYFRWLAHYPLIDAEKKRFGIDAVEDYNKKAFKQHIFVMGAMDLQPNRHNLRMENVWHAHLHIAAEKFPRDEVLMQQLWEHRLTKRGKFKVSRSTGAPLLNGATAEVREYNHWLNSPGYTWGGHREGYEWGFCPMTDKSCKKSWKRNSSCYMCDHPRTWKQRRVNNA